LEIAALCNPEVPDLVRSDRDRLRQILINLVSNAVKFTEQGYVTVSSHLVSQTETTATICLQVTDTGIGMRRESCEKLFQPFSQEYSQSTRKYGGTGLGLAICQKLTHLMNGQIQVDSEVGQGSTFSVTIPFPKQTSPPEPLQSKWQGYRLLVADSSDIAQQAIQYQLQFWGIEATGVSSSTEVVETLQQADNQQTPYHGIFLDLNLPPQGAWVCIQQIKQHPQLASIPIVLLSSIDQRQQARENQAAGLTAIAVKPVKREKLREILTQVLPSGKIDTPSKPLAGESSFNSQFLLTEDCLKPN
jgi:CheY-like chemotaxis protein